MIHISTGRRNQIRCHMHDIKHPILGDSRYDSKYNPLGRLALHANKLVITNPISKKELTFVSKIPLEFYNLVK
jgi:23S rRNA pseudouridine1911/1915/1917 synthase